MQRIIMITALLLAACCLGGNVLADTSGPRQVTVEAEGAGSNKDEAMKSAWMEAVRQAVGMYIAADTQMTDDELTEKSAEFSRGQVNDYELLSVNQSDGLWHVKIRANIDQDLLQVSAPKSARSVRVAVDDGAVAQVATGNEKTESRGDVLDVSKRLLDFTDCLDYSAKLEPFTDETGKQGFRMRHQLLFDLEKYNGRVQELHLLFGKIAAAKKDMPYLNGRETGAILNMLKTKQMPVLDEKAMTKVIEWHRFGGNANPFHSRPVTYLPAKVSAPTECDVQGGRIEYAGGCAPHGEYPFHVVSLYDNMPEDLRNSLVIPKNASTGTVYRVQEYEQIRALFEKPLTLRFHTDIGEGLTGESMAGPAFTVRVGLWLPRVLGEKDMLVLAPVFAVNWDGPYQLFGSPNSPGIVFYQKLDMTPEDVARNKNDINAGYILD